MAPLGALAQALAGRSTVGPTPTVHVVVHSELPAEVVLAAARDFSGRRALMWPDVHVEYLVVHEIGEDHAEVTEGNPWPIGYVWERLRYDWSDPNALCGTVIDSNLFKPGEHLGVGRHPRIAAAGWRSTPYATCVAGVGCSPRSSHLAPQPRPYVSTCNTFWPTSRRLR
jgi:hypothetical protein